MNVQLQCVYGGGSVGHSVFRGQEIRERRHRIFKHILVVILGACLCLLCALLLRALFNPASVASITSSNTTMTTTVKQVDTPADQTAAPSIAASLARIQKTSNAG